MKKTMTAAAALCLGATAATAGGIERTNQAVGVLFEEGRYLEFSAGRVNPSVSGVTTAASPTGAGNASGDILPGYNQFGAAYKMDINDRVALAFIFDQPFGADLAYPGGTAYYATTSTATLESNAITALAKYTNENNFSVYGGVRYQTLSAEAFVPYTTNPANPIPYTASGAQDGGFGYVLGAAYERPEIALRVALTYNSKVKHKLTTTESSLLTGGANVTSTTVVETPQSVALDFQSGVNPKTLVFGSIRWVNWSDFDITPANFLALTAALSPTGTGVSLVSYEDDTVTYTLGVGRRINDKLAVSGRIAYEGANGGFASNLGPTDGQTAFTLAASYKVNENGEIAGGISYVNIGDAETTLDGANAFGEFKNNSAIGIGLRYAYRF